MDQKPFFEYTEKFGYSVLLNLFYNENLCYLLCFCTNPIFGKISVTEIQTKMFSANETASIFKSTISPEQMDEIASFFCMLI